MNQCLYVPNPFSTRLPLTNALVSYSGFLKVVMPMKLHRSGGGCALLMEQ